MSKESRIFDGWLTRYKINRGLSLYELESVLEVDRPINIPLMDKGLIRVNSVFVEFIDRFFFLRGWATMGFLPFAIAWSYFAFLFGSTIYVPPGDGAGLSFEHILSGWIATITIVVFLVVMCVFGLCRDFFCYTYYPIRFNRENRKVYVFRHNKKNGVLTLEWNKVFWFIGRSRDGSRYIYDLRGHVLDDEKIVRYTFAVGQYGETQAEILQHWETIRLYMEESPAALPYPPLALSLSTQPTLRNCLLIQMGWLVSGRSPVVLLFGVVWGFFRWLALKTCRQPRWPADIEAACQIPANDPYRQTEPLRAGEFPDFGEAEELRQSEYIREARAAAEAYEQARSKANAS